jgi:hypothetical protein
MSEVELPAFNISKIVPNPPLATRIQITIMVAPQPSAAFSVFGSLVRCKDLCFNGGKLELGAELGTGGAPGAGGASNEAPHLRHETVVPPYVLSAVNF